MFGNANHSMKPDEGKNYCTCDRTKELNTYIKCKCLDCGGLLDTQEILSVGDTILPRSVEHYKKTQKESFDLGVESQQQELERLREFVSFIKKHHEGRGQYNSTSNLIAKKANELLKEGE